MHVPLQLLLELHLSLREEVNQNSDFPLLVSDDEVLLIYLETCDGAAVLEGVKFLKVPCRDDSQFVALLGHYDIVIVVEQDARDIPIDEILELSNVPHQCCIVIEHDGLDIRLVTAPEPGLLDAALLANAVLLQLLHDLVPGDAETANRAFLIKRVDGASVGAEEEGEDGVLMKGYFIGYGGLLDAE